MNDAEAKRLVDTYSDMILKICFTYMKNTEDAEDICQNVFLKLLTGNKKFEDDEHEKAWIIRVAVNECKDLLKSAYKQRNVNVDITNDIYTKDETLEEELSDIVNSLPESYREVIYLYYYEGYSIREIADILGQSEASVTKRLSRGRKKIEKNFFQDECALKNDNRGESIIYEAERGII